MMFSIPTYPSLSAAAFCGAASTEEKDQLRVRLLAMVAQLSHSAEDSQRTPDQRDSQVKRAVCVSILVLCCGDFSASYYTV